MSHGILDAMRTSVLIFCLLLGSFSFAAEEPSSISVHPYLNASDVLEVRVDAANWKNFFASLNPTIAYGRDLSGDGKIDTWFFLSEMGVEVVRKEGLDRYGRDIIEGLVRAKYKTSELTYLSSATLAILSTFFFTAEEYKSHSENFYLDWINLEELSLRLETEIKNPLSNLTENQIRAQRELLYFGFQRLSDKVAGIEGGKGYRYTIGLDLGIAMVGGAILKWRGQLLSPALVKFFDDNIFNFLKTQQGQLASKLKVLSTKFQGEKTKQVATQVVLRTSAIAMAQSWRTNVKMLVRAYIAKKKLLTMASGLLKGIKKQAPYVALNVGLQSIAEVIAHWNDIRNPNFATMGKNFLSRKDVQQDIGFMTMDTVLMFGVSNYLKTFKTRVIACGLVALTNSSIVNFLIKRDDDYERIAVDTSWEATIGNLQIQFDREALEYYEKLGQANSNPGLKWLGYALVVVNQTSGYFLYSGAPEEIGKLVHGEPPKPAVTPILVPILASP